MVSCAHAQHCSTHLEKLLPKRIDEDWVLIRDDTAGKAMEFTHSVHEQAGHFESRELSW